MQNPTPSPSTEQSPTDTVIPVPQYTYTPAPTLTDIPLPTSTFTLSTSLPAKIVDDYGSGLRVLESSNPTAPVEVGFYDTLGLAYGVDVSGGYVYVADYDGGDPYSLQIMLGHSTMDMVKRYLSIAQADLDKNHKLASPVDNWRL